MATIYLHIGAPKTATSMLQEAMLRSADTLLEKGWLYPASCRNGSAHHVLVCDLIDKYQQNPMPPMWYGDYPRGSAWSALAEELQRKADQVHSVLLSSELFFGQSHQLPVMLNDIRQALPGHEFKILVYLRPQHQLYSSFYNQDVKGMRQWPDSAYEFYETHQIFQRSYLQILRVWAEAFGADSLIIRPYESTQWPRGEVLADFASALGISGVKLKAGGDSNEGLGINQLYIKRSLNRIGFAKEDNERVALLLQQLCPERSASDVLYVNRGLYTRLCGEWRAVNQALSEEFLGGRPLFQEPFPEADELRPFAPDDKRLLLFLKALEGGFCGSRDSELRQLFARAALLIIAERSFWQALPSALLSRLQGWCLEH